MESLLAKRWIYSTLAGDAPLVALAPGGIWDRKAGPEAAGQKRIIVLPLTPGRHAAGVGTARGLTTSVILVKAVYEGADPEELEPIGNRIDQLLHGQTNITVAGGAMVSCINEQAYEDDYIAHGAQYWELGSIYRLLTQAD